MFYRKFKKLPINMDKDKLLNDEKEDTKKKEPGFELLVNIIKWYKGVIGIAIFAFVTCIVWSIVFDFEKSTFTHCRVKNYLPSVSASIGGYVPQKYIWQFLISLHCSPRLFFAHFSRQFYFSFSNPTRMRHMLVNVMTGVEIIEVLSLQLLTIISSTELYEWHEKSFIIFIMSSQINMILKIVLFTSIRNLPEFNSTLKQSLTWKRRVYVLNLVGIVSAMFFFLRHNSYCETGVYTLFALSEYLVVISNMVFHGTGFYEFGSTNCYIWSNCNLAHSALKNKPT